MCFILCPSVWDRRTGQVLFGEWQAISENFIIFIIHYYIILLFIIYLFIFIFIIFIIFRYDILANKDYIRELKERPLLRGSLLNT